MKVDYRTVEDLAQVWCAWTEMEIRLKRYDLALGVAKRSVEEGCPCRRSQRCWMLLGDLTESLGTLEDVKRVYQGMIDLKLATPQVILNFASILEEKRYFEEAFTVYEKGVSAFSHPHSTPIWATYLAKFVGRYGGKKV